MPAEIKTVVPADKTDRKNDGELVFITLGKKEYTIVFTGDDYYSDTFFMGSRHHRWSHANGREGTDEETQALVRRVVGVCEDMLGIAEGFHLYRNVENDGLKMKDYRDLHKALKDIV